MMNPSYLLPRLVRHFLPEKWVRFLLLRHWIIRPGAETREPAAVAQRYEGVLHKWGSSIQGKRVMVFGYGGRFDIGLSLLDAGADSVVLLEKYAPPDDEHNHHLLTQYSQHLSQTARRIRPRGYRLALLQADVRDLKAAEVASFDLIVSNSVYEHLDDVEGITRALSGLTKPDGLQIHFVDLRDHFFKYPFQMLSYSERTWRRWLNPSSNHNRYRIWDYERAFRQWFANVEITILQRDEAALRKALPGIRPEFVSGDLERDSVTHIQIVASGPNH